MTLHILGIDISKATFDVALDMEGRMHEEPFANNRTGIEALGRWLDKQDANQLHACMEATGRYWEELAEWLFGRGYEVSVVNPARIRAYSISKLLRNKTDKVDARTSVVPRIPTYGPHHRLNKDSCVTSNVVYLLYRVY